MKETIKELLEKFEDIRKKGYIKGIIQKSKGSPGLTFEHLIGKESDELPIADYNGIEIKVKKYFSYRYITLFSLVPSNSFGMLLKDFRENYGREDKTFKDVKVFSQSIYADKMVYVNSGFYFKLQIDYSEEKVRLLIYDNTQKLIDNNIYWDFIDIKKTLERKLKVLALVKYQSKTENEENFFKYEKIMFFKLKYLSTFFKLLENGTIRLYICLGVYKSGYKIGKEHDHGTTFGIKEKDILKLYEKYDY